MKQREGHVFFQKYYFQYQNEKETPVLFVKVVCHRTDKCGNMGIKIALNNIQTSISFVQGVKCTLKNVYTHSTYIHLFLHKRDRYMIFFSSVQFSHSVMSDSFRPHESQHARPPCPSPTPRVYPNPCPSSR